MLHSLEERHAVADTLEPFTARSDEACRYATHCIPPRRYDWSLTQLSNPAFADMLGERLAMMGVRRAYAPTMPEKGMSGVILPPRKFSERIVLPHEVELLRAPYPCEGTLLKEQDAFVMAAGGCALLVVTGPGFCCMAHAGRDSLIDRKWVKEGQTSRTDFSVINSIARRIKKLGMEPADMTMRWFYEIDLMEFPHPFDHPRYGASNLELYKYLEQEYGPGIMPVVNGCNYLDLGALITYQATQAGFGNIEPGMRSLPVRGLYAYTTHPDPTLTRKSRNLVVAQVLA